MPNAFPLRLGVADDPGKVLPTLGDCLSAMLAQAQPLMAEVIRRLARGTIPFGPESIPALQQPGIKSLVLALAEQEAAVRTSFHEELSRLMYEGGGKEQAPDQVLRFEDLNLFGDAELDQSIEVARAQQEVMLCVQDVMPTVDALVSTLLGWRTIQPGLNPIRPETYARALQATLVKHVPQPRMRELLVLPAGGLLGTHLRRLYKELADWLQSAGIEPAVPVGGRLHQGSGATGAATSDSMAKTQLTLDRLRKLLAGDFDAPARKPDVLYTVPASMALLQEMKQVDALMKRLEQRPRPATPPKPPANGLNALAEEETPSELGEQLGEEVVRLMFDTLAQDERLMTGYRVELRAFQPPVLRLAQQDSRFFSDRTHPARQLLDQMTQRSLAFKSDQEEGWQRFLSTVQYASRWLSRSKVVDSQVFSDLLEHLGKVWTEDDQVARQKREEAARELLHVEQRNLLARKLGTEFVQATAGQDAPPMVVDFLKGPWAQVVAEAQLTCTDGSDDPFGYRALVRDLVWSVQRSPSRRRAARLAQMIPALVLGIRDGLRRIDHPPELTQRFLDQLVAVHEEIVEFAEDEGQTIPGLTDTLPQPVPEPSFEQDSAGDSEVPDSVWIDSAGRVQMAAAREAANDLSTGTWAELMVDDEWLRVQLTWASPHGTLFMFTGVGGTAHSMSRRTLKRLRAQGLLRIVADRPVMDDAFDQVAQAALKNTLLPKV